MRFKLQILLAATLVLAPCAASAAPRDDKANALKGLAARVGRVIGAATACPNISRNRINGIAARITDIIKTQAEGEQQSTALLETLHASEAEGTWAVSEKQQDCAKAALDLADLEGAIAPAAQVPALAAAAPAILPAAGPSGPVQPAAAALAAAEETRGVSATEIRFGASVPLSGPNKEYGQQTRIGFEIAFNAVNDAGGIYGRKLRLVAADDGYEPERTAVTVKQLYEKQQVFGFIGNFGTATAAVSVPYALEHQMLFYAPYTGAPVVRRDPPDRYVFNYRPSYAEETEAAVRYLVKIRRIKPEQIAVFAQQDGFGLAGYQGVAKAIRQMRGGENITILHTTYARNSLDVDPAIAALKAAKTPVKAVVMVATYRAAAKFIEKTRDAIPGLIYTNPSAVGANSLRDELNLLGPRFASGVIVTQVVPAVEGYSSIVMEYKRGLAQYFSGENPDATALEYYISGKILIEALKRAGPKLDTEKLVEAFEGMRNFDMGIGTAINFSASEHQGLHKIWGTQLNDAGKYEPIELE